MFQRNYVYDGEHSVRFCDFSFFPKQEAQIKVWKKIFEFFMNEKNNSFIKNISSYQQAEYEYQIYLMTKGREPDWIMEFPQFIRKEIRRNCERENTYPFKIVNEIPYAKLDYQVLEGGLVSRLYDCFGMHRLFDVRQLGFLRFPTVFEKGVSQIMSMTFPHTRGVHQLDTTAIMMSIIRNNHELKEHKYVLEAAACSHDGRTPAGSDTTKFINLEGFDEELNFNSYFNNIGWEQLRNFYGIDEKLLDETVNGKGFLGTLLDIADKSAYISRDTSHFFGGSKNIDEYRSGDSSLLHQAREIIKKDPYFASIWQSVWFNNGEVFFFDAKKLFLFLKMRAILFVELYKNDQSRFMENILAKKLIKILYENKEVSKQQLLHWTDTILEDVLVQKFGISFSFLTFSRSKYKEFENENEREIFLNENTSPDLMPIIDDFVVKVKSGTEKFKVDKKNEIKIFAEAYPEAAKEIDNILSQPKKCSVLLVHREDLNISEEIWKYIKQF